MRCAAACPCSWAPASPSVPPSPAWHWGARLSSSSVPPSPGGPGADVGPHGNALFPSWRGMSDGQLGPTCADERHPAGTGDAQSNERSNPVHRRQRPRHGRHPRRHCPPARIAHTTTASLGFRCATSQHWARLAGPEGALAIRSFDSSTRWFSPAATVTTSGCSAASSARRCRGTACGGARPGHRRRPRHPPRPSPTSA